MLYRFGMRNQKIDTFRALIDLWPAPSRSNFARDLGLDYVHAQSMHRRNSISPKHWPGVVAAAEVRGIPGITTELLAGLAMARDLERAAS